MPKHIDVNELKELTVSFNPNLAAIARGCADTANGLVVLSLDMVLEWQGDELQVLEYLASLIDLTADAPKKMSHHLKAGITEGPLRILTGSV